jgi:hypothetical protein
MTDAAVSSVPDGLRGRFTLERELSRGGVRSERRPSPRARRAMKPNVAADLLLVAGLNQSINAMPEPRRRLR